MTDVTQILNAIEQGNPQAAEQLLPLVYDELRKLAAARMAQEKPGQTLQAAALVHEAYLRLTVGQVRVEIVSDDQAIAVVLASWYRPSYRRQQPHPAISRGAAPRIMASSGYSDESCLPPTRTTGLHTAHRS